MLPTLLALLLACDGKPEDTAERPHDPCEDRNQVTWEGFGDAFFGQWCRSCHSASAADRQGAPAYMNFDTPDEVATYASAVRRSVIEFGSMPVEGEVPEADLILLGDLLDCGL